MLEPLVAKAARDGERASAAHGKGDEFTKIRAVDQKQFAKFRKCARKKIRLIVLVDIRIGFGLADQGRVAVDERNRMAHDIGNRKIRAPRFFEPILERFERETVNASVGSRIRTGAPVFGEYSVDALFIESARFVPET